MEKIEAYKEAVQKLIISYAETMHLPKDIEVQCIFDTERNHYQLFHTGWNDSQWIHGCVFHIDIRKEKVWIQHNGTEDDIAQELMNLGVQREDIVLGFHAPYKRKYTGFAVE